MPSARLDDVALRITSFSLPNRWLLWSRARLYADRLVLSGWGLWERYWRHIPLDEIEEVQQTGGRRLALQLEDGTEVALRLRKAPQWRDAIRTHRAVYDGD